MILRKRKIDEQADELQLAICYNRSDLLRWCRCLYLTLSVNPGSLKFPWTQGEIIDFFYNAIFTDFKQKHRKSLSRWACSSAIRHGFFWQDLKHPENYYLSERLRIKPGHPPKENEE